MDDMDESATANGDSQSHSESSSDTVSPMSESSDDISDTGSHIDFPSKPLYGQLLAAAEDNTQSLDDVKDQHGETGLALMSEGEAAGQRDNSRPSPRVQSAYDPRALLNPKSANKRPASDTDSDRGRNDVAPSGQVSLVERLHNVHQRTASPAKRVRTEDDIKKQQPRSTPSGGGTLQINSTQSVPPPSDRSGSASIDLTMSDEEEEIRVVKDNSKETICIGKVKQAYVQAHQVPFPDPQKYRGNHGSQGRIKVSFRRGGIQKASNMIIVVDPTGKEFGRIDNRTAQGLAPLMDGAKQNGLQWIAVTEPRRKTPNEGPPGTSLSLLIALTLQLYCPRKIAHEIGRYLKTRNIMLGDPILDLAKYDYYNPQTQNHFTVKDTTQPEFMAAYTASQHTPANFVVRNVEEIRDDVFSMFDRIVKQEDIPRRQQSSLIKTPLLKHQEQALYFMLDKEAEWFNDEETPKDSLWKVGVDGSGRKTYTHVITGEKRAHKPETIRGGILADEMGLGKTLSILALVVDDESVTAAKTFALKSPPLQHGMRRQVLNSRATLLLCPLSTMVNWKTQVNDHFAQGKGIKWCYYHGPDRKNYTPESLADHDLVITTYHVAANDAFDQKMPLGLINWFRLVLDEAHAIRSGKTKQALAVYSLEAQRRWAVTGTPVQNRLDDLGALFRFLRLKPFSDKAGFNTHIVSPFKAADPDVVPKLQLLVGSLTLRRLKEGNVVLPPRSDQIVRLQFSEDERKLHEWFEQESARQVNAVTSGEKIGGAVYARILKAILNLRLICAHGRDLLGDDALKLTEGMTSENPMELEDEEEYTPTLTRKPAFEMLELLEQTDTDRCQFCRSRVCEPEAGEADDDSDGDDSDSGDLEHSKRNLIGFMTPCYHIICPRHVKQLRSAWSKITAEDGHVTCQFCETRIRPTLFELTRTDREAFDKERERLRRDPKLAKKMGAYTGPHTKTKALLEELEKNKEESLANPDSPPIKSVVFSCWTTHLDLIGIALEQNGHPYTRLDGRMDRKARDRALLQFANDPTVPIILVSIGAGGLGLNLTVANKAYVMEPQFNPAAEAQAVDRVHRLGQTRPVTIMRFIMENSFEEKMLELQRKKKALADLTMAREKASKEQLAKQKLEDLRSLFR